MNHLEQIRLQLQSKLDAEKTQDERNRLGQFATPGKLAEQIIAAGLALFHPHDSIRFFDPGFGTGSFFSSLLAQIHPHRLTKAGGFEIDSYYGLEAKSLWQDSLLDLKLEDFTKAKPPTSDHDKYNLLICNPPYVRHHHLDRAQKENLVQSVQLQTGRRMNGLSGLYCYFLLLSQAWMTKQGIGVWLIPSEFMDVNYGGQVKRFLLENVTLLRIHRFDPLEVQFADALVSSAVVFIRNEQPAPNHEVQFTFGGSLGTPEKTSLQAADRLKHASKWTTIATRRASAPKKSNRKLSDLFVIKRGLATGCNSFFVISAEKARELCIPYRFLAPILPSPRYLTVDEIEADDKGNPLLKNSRLLIDCNLSEMELQRESPELWAYFQSGKKSGIDRRYLCLHRDPWYSQERRAAPLFLCTYMGRSSQKNHAPFRFILNHSKAVAANVYLLLYPRLDRTAELLRSPDLRRKVWKCLNEITTETLTDEGRLYGGGLHKMEPKELANVPADTLFELLPDVLPVKQATLF